MQIIWNSKCHYSIFLLSFRLIATKPVTINDNEMTNEKSINNIVVSESIAIP